MEKPQLPRALRYIPGEERGEPEPEPPKPFGPPNLKKVAIAGHSYVKRLRVQPGKIYEPGPFEIRCFSQSGATVQTFRWSKAFKKLVRYRPDFVLLVLDGNDIHPTVVPRELAARLANLCLAIEDYTGSRCNLVGIECRENPRGMSAERFTKIKNQVNMNLKRICRIQGRYVPMNFRHEFLDFDGVHLMGIGSDRLLAHLIEIAKTQFA